MDFSIMKLSWDNVFSYFGLEILYFGWHEFSAWNPVPLSHKTHGHRQVMGNIHNRHHVVSKGAHGEKKTMNK